MTKTMGGEKMENLKKESLRVAAEPLIKWLQENGTPHSCVIVQLDSAELLNGEVVANFKVLD